MGRRVFRVFFIFFLMLAWATPSHAAFGYAPDWLSAIDTPGPYIRCASGDINGDGYDDLVVGTPHLSPNGRVTLYLGSSSGLASTPAWSWTTSSTAYATQVGWDIDLNGDANGDGFQDLAIGAWNYQNGHYDEGALFVFHGGSGGPASIPDWSFESDDDGLGLGHGIAWADTNGDGRSDLFATGSSNMAYGFWGSATGLLSTPSWNASFWAKTIARAGDVNHDGFEDLALGQHWFSNGSSNEGRIHLFYGSASGPAAIADQTVEADQADAGYGEYMNFAGDINGDGYADLLLSNPNWPVPYPGSGYSRLLAGSPLGLSAAPIWDASGTSTYALQGGPIWGLGDVNADGYGDFASGVLGNLGSWPVEVRVFLGGPQPISSIPSWSYTSNAVQTTAESGWQNGDYNGDGARDLAFSVLTGTSYQIAVFYNSSSPPSETPTPTPLPAQLNLTSIQFSPSPICLGQSLQLVATVSNSGIGSALAVSIPATLIQFDDAGLVLISVPSPASLNLSSGASAGFTFTYSAVGTGTVSFSALAIAYDQGSMMLLNSNGFLSDLLQVVAACNTSTATPTASPSATGTSSPTSDPSASATATASPSTVPSMTASPTFSPTASPSPSPSALATPSPSATLTPSPGPGPVSIPSQEELVLIRGVYPVPASGPISVYYTVRQACELAWSIYNVAGEMILEGRAQARQGRNLLLWDVRNQSGSPVASGLYLIRLQAQGITGSGSEAWVWAALAF